MRLPRDHYVRLDGNDYSVHPSAVGRRVEVSADLEQSRWHCAGREVARHARCWAKHQTITDPDHATAAVVLRGQHQRHRAAADRTRTSNGAAPEPTTTHAFGLDDEQVA